MFAGPWISMLLGSMVAKPCAVFASMHEKHKRERKAIRETRMGERHKESERCDMKKMESVSYIEGGRGGYYSKAV